MQNFCTLAYPDKKRKYYRFPNCAKPVVGRPNLLGGDSVVIKYKPGSGSKDCVQYKYTRSNHKGAKYVAASCKEECSFVCRIPAIGMIAVVSNPKAKYFFFLFNV